MALGDLVQSLAADPTQAQAGILTPDQIKRRQALADALTKEGSSYAPVQSWTQGAARLASALNGKMQENRANQAARDNADWFRSQIAGLAGGDASAAATPSASPATSSPASGSGGTATAMAPSDLLPLYQKAEAETGVPASVLMAQHKQESEFNPNAVGKAGEIGLGQILPSTARDPGYGMTGVDPQSLYDPAANIAFSARYLAARAKAAGQKDWSNPAAGLAAYNGGGDPNYVSNVTRYMPKGVQVASADPSQAMSYAASPAAGGASAPAQTAIDAANVPTPPVRPGELTPSASPYGSLPSADAKAKLQAAMAKSDGNDEEDDDDEDDAPATKTAAAASAAAPTQAAAVAQPNAGAAQAKQMQILRLMADPRVSPEQRQVLGMLYAAAQKDKQFGAVQKDAYGNVGQYGPDGKWNTITDASDLQPDKPNSVLEYEYAKKNGFSGSYQDWQNQGAGGKMPATVQEYEYAKKNGFKGSFEDWQSKKAMKFANFDTEADKELVESLATRLIKGDTTWKTGLAKDPGLIRRVETRAAEMGKGMEGGFNADTILQNRANQAGRVKEQGTLGTSTANNTLYGNAAANTIDTAIQASRDLPRTDWVPVNKLLQMGEGSISNPKLAAFRTALLTTVNDYAKATTPTGTPTDSQRNHAYEVLNTAVGPKGVEAVLRMMHREIANTHRAIELTKQQLQSGKGGHLPELTAPPAGPDVQGSQGVGLWDAIKSATGFGHPQAVTVKSPEEARKLPPGTTFQTPDGRTFTR